MKAISTPISDCVRSGEVSDENAVAILGPLNLMIHGGGFDWKTFFLQGVESIKKKDPKSYTKEEKRAFASRSIDIGLCIKGWAEEDEMVRVLYDFLSQVVHPNKGSNLLLIDANERGLHFGGRATRLACLMVDGIFPEVSERLLGVTNDAVRLLGVLGESE